MASEVQDGDTREGSFTPQVYVVVEHPDTCDELCELLRAASYRAWAFRSARDFLYLADRLNPGCVIADIGMMEHDGLGILAELKRRHLSLPVVFLAKLASTATMVAAIRAGAVDFVERPFSADGLRASVRGAFDEIEHTRRADDLSREALRSLSRLTEREREVLHLLVTGRTNKAIAQELTISVRTVEFYRGRAMRKMNARGLLDLVRLALAAGIQPNAR